MTSKQTSPPITSGGIYSQALGTDQIRVLALQPGSGEEPLACHLRIVNIEDATSSYEAVSYVWGSQETPAIISCRADDEEAEIDLPITQNAAEALRAVRKPQAERLIWIDSICISQTSLVEKGTQVAMMDRIFTNAAAVLVWLGPADETRPAAAEALFNRTVEDPFDSESQSKPNEYRRFRYVRNGSMHYAHEEVETLLGVFESAYFWRLWCVQELVLAKRVFVYWGSVRVAWENFASAAAYVQAEDGDVVARTGLSGVYNVAMLESFRRYTWEGQGNSLPFSRLLNLTRLHGVTERRDRIFSMLGLDGHLCTTDSSGVSVYRHSPLVKPDYSQNLEDLYYSVAKCLLTREKNLYLLSFVQHDKEVGSSILPSWVPQWHVNEHRLITQFDLIAGHPVNESLRTAWAKSANKTPSSTGSQKEEDRSFDLTAEGALQVDGLHLDTVVAKCSNAVFTSGRSHDWVNTLRRWFCGVMVWFTRHYQYCVHNARFLQLEDLAFRVFYRTLFGGHLKSKHLWYALKDEFHGFRNLVLSDAPGDTCTCQTSRAVVTQMCRSRTLFLTSKGQLGIGPQCTLVGDSICYLHGAAVPFLLRASDNAPGRWHLVGETYVNGLLSSSHDYHDEEIVELQGSGSASDDMTASHTQARCECRIIRRDTEICNGSMIATTEGAYDNVELQSQSTSGQSRPRTYERRPQEALPVYAQRGPEHEPGPSEIEITRRMVRREFRESSAPPRAYVEPPPQDLDFGERLRFVID